MQIQQQTRTLSPQQISRWAEGHTETMRLRTFRDVVPGGYMAALAPLLVDWRISEPRSDKPFVVMRNVNYGGNPLEKTTVLHSVRIPLNAVEAAEFTLVPSLPLEHRSPVQHAQLRFIFTAHEQPELLSLSGSETGTDPHIPDMVFSWESWRPPDVRFSLLQGLDDHAYALSLRAYAGPQRYLEDALRQRDWYSYRLRMPGGQAGLRELLQVTIALGDGVARHTLYHLLQSGEEEWLSLAPAGAGGAEDARRLWQELQARLHGNVAPAGAPTELPAEQQTYHALLRSCVTLARYSILLAAQRLIERGLSDGVMLDRLPEPALGASEPWMTAASRADLRGLFITAPAALRFLIGHSQSMPTSIPDELDDAGLLERRNGKPWMIRYGRDAVRPYSAVGVKPVE